MDADTGMGRDADGGADSDGSADPGGDADGLKDLVRRGYDAVSLRYDEHYGSGTKYQPLLGELIRRVPAGGTVLDVGCGSGVPVARTLDAAGLRVTGVDISQVQVRRARQAVPGARFVQADATEASFGAAAFDAVVCLYALIHLPLDDQRLLLGRTAAWLRPGGTFLATTGHRAWTGAQEDWLGGGAPMWWSHADAATNRRWITEAGLTVERQEFVAEGGGHALFWAHRPPRTGTA